MTDEEAKDFVLSVLSEHSDNPVPLRVIGSQAGIDNYLDAHGSIAKSRGRDVYCAAVIASKTDRYKSMHNPQHLEELINLAAAEYVPTDYDPIEVMEGVDDVGY